MAVFKVWSGRHTPPLPQGKPRTTEFICVRDSRGWIDCAVNWTSGSILSTWKMTLQPLSPPAWVVFFLQFWDVELFLQLLVLSVPGPGNAVLIKSHNNIGRCGTLIPIDNPNCQKGRYRGEFNHLKTGCKIVWFYFQLSLPSTCFQPRVSFDEGHSWNKYGFTSVPLFVDGALVEAGVETQIMTWVLLCLWSKGAWRPGFYFHGGHGLSPGRLTWKDFSLWTKVSSSVRWTYLCNTHQFKRLLTGLEKLGFQLKS